MKLSASKLELDFIVSSSGDAIVIEAVDSVIRLCIEQSPDLSVQVHPLKDAAVMPEDVLVLVFPKGEASFTTAFPTKSLDNELQLFRMLDSKKAIRDFTVDGAIFSKIKLSWWFNSFQKKKKKCEQVDQVCVSEVIAPLSVFS